MVMSEQIKSTPLGGKLWFNAIFFGLAGQVAWIVENMYFATFAQDIFANSGRGDLSYIVTTFMVILSALTATVTTIIAGGFSDKFGKRKPFIAWGYLFWSLTILLFAFIPMQASGDKIVLIAVLLVLFDCIMTAAGSTANDAAFNAWVVDVTDSTNRGKVNSVLTLMPLFAVAIVFVGLGSLYNAQNESNASFFIAVAAVPFIAGILALFLVKDAPGITPSALSAKDFFAGFQPGMVKSHTLLYICLSATCLIGIAQQTFFSYLINFLVRTLGLGDSFILPIAIIILGAAAITGVCGALFDKLGRNKFYIPLLVCTILGMLGFYFVQYVNGGPRLVVLYIGGVIMMGSLMSLQTALSATFQDQIPAGLEGRFQGVRMCFSVFLPMVIGPVVSLLIGLDAMGMNGADFVPPFTIFLAAAIIAAFAFIPIRILMKKNK